MMQLTESYQLPQPKTMAMFSLIMILLGTLSYYYIDQPVAEWTYYNTRESSWSFIWKNATHLQPLYYALSPIVTIYIIARFALGKTILLWHKVAIIMIFSMSITLFLNEQLRVIFGRHWPSTWYHGNLSWIEHKAYGFTWFKMQHEFKSFPSGHTALMFGLMMVLYWAMPNTKARVFALVNCFAVAASIIFMCYHFVSDVLIAALVGTLVAYLMLYGLQLWCNDLRESNVKIRK